MKWSFSTLVGQDAAIGRLRNERKKNRVSHAYLFEGVPGTGRQSMARGYAGEILCLSGTACGECRPCRLLDRGVHPDVLELPREPRELRLARMVERSGPVDVEHEPLLSFLHLKPVEGDRRVVIIPDAERLRSEAANAFLKTLEEPPGQALLLLTTSARDRLLPTIVSRCRREATLPLSEAVVTKLVVERAGVDEASAFSAARAAEGSLGLALRLVEGETLATWRWLDEEAFQETTVGGAERLVTGWLERMGRGKDSGEKRSIATELLDLSALSIRRRMRSGLPAVAGAAALEVLWTAGEQILLNVKPELAMSAAAMETMAALRRA